MTVVIPTSGTSALLDLLLEDLRSQTVQPELVHVVVNNERADLNGRRWDHSPRGMVTYLNRGHYYAKGVNVALRQLHTEYVAVINDDVRLLPTWVEAIMAAVSQHPKFGSFASRVISLRDESRLDSCGDSLYLSGRATANGWLEPLDCWTDPCEVFSASGCLATYRVADIARAGLLDEDFTAYMEDVDLGFRLQLLDRRCLYWPYAEAAHVGGATRKTPRLAARLAERNSVLTMVKNMPCAVAATAASDFIQGHCSPCSFEGYRSWSAWCSGKASSFRGLRAALRKRDGIQANRSASDAYIQSIIKPGSPDRCHL
jgi:GT2 family glycosyltransferase